MILVLGLRTRLDREARDIAILRILALEFNLGCERSAGEELQSAAFVLVGDPD